MTRRWLLTLLWTGLLPTSMPGLAFRNCDVGASEAYSAETIYVVGEVSFDSNSGAATGTETTYNHSNREQEGFTRCHVTYELSGSFEPVSGTLVLDGRRTNHSHSCPGELVRNRYPQERLYALQIDFRPDGSSLVRSADSGHLLAQGDWSGGSIAYRTPETCMVF